MPPLAAPVDVDELVQLYETGESVKALAEHFGVSRRTIHSRLVGVGIAPRSASEAQFILAARRTPEERRRQAAAAHAAKRGRPNSRESRERAARTREASGKFANASEAMLSEWLHARGMPVTPQVAIGKYNADLALHPVAVEVFGGNWHATGHHASRYPPRCQEILDRGWSLAIVWDQSRCPMRVEAADQVVALYELARRHPTPLREYRVIWGNGKVLSRGRRKFDKSALVPSQRRG